jgi:hypothetical protein
MQDTTHVAALPLKTGKAVIGSVFAPRRSEGIRGSGGAIWAQFQIGDIRKNAELDGIKKRTY